MEHDNYFLCKQCHLAFHMDDYIIDENAKYCNICDSLINPPKQIPVNLLRERILQAIIKDEQKFQKEIKVYATKFAKNCSKELDLQDIELAFIEGANFAKNRKPSL